MNLFSTRKFHLSDSARFVLPVIAENIFTAGVSLVYSAVTGAISSGSLAATAVGNQALNVISALFCVLSSGATILTARLTGKGDRHSASLTVEQTLLLAPISSVIVTALLLIFSSFIMKLLMPGAEKEFLREGTLYFRMIMLSVPFVVLMNSAGGILRAAGQSRTALFGIVITNTVQLVCLYLFTSVLHMEIRGVALSSVVCRIVSAVFFVMMLLRSKRDFNVDKRRIFHPNLPIIKRILGVGVPAAIDAMAVQLGYTIINSIMVSMGGIHAMVVSVLNSVLLFTGLSQSIGTNASTTLVGQKVGAGDIAQARRMVNKILLICELCSVVLCVPAILLSDFSAGLFTKDADILKASSELMWLQLPYCIVAVGVNVCEPAARVGGEVKYVMLSISLCVLLIRLPLTYLFCIQNNGGALGVYTANIISLLTRFALSYLIVRSKKWGRREL